MGTRLELSAILHEFLGSDNVYFQPPASRLMKYPAIRYSLNRIDLIKADNKNYNKPKSYTVILIHNDPDNTLKDDILDLFDHISFVNHYVADNLNHYVYTLYY
ncbi:MAG: hypothetical protein J6Y02_22170 [Pseudobutyrivibrio sp.]|nr:hypothetical protein [Pseudobutyrivibrio sp.]